VLRRISPPSIFTHNFNMHMEMNAWEPTVPDNGQTILKTGTNIDDQPIVVAHELPLPREREKKKIKSIAY
jgi:hypothetical protein